VSSRLITVREALERVSFSKSHLYRLINRGEFPRPVVLGLHKVAFLESEIETWIDARAKARTTDRLQLEGRASTGVQRQGAAS
jgi:prophage regulatory protein